MIMAIPDKKYRQVVIGATTLELYKCNRGLNRRDDLLVYVHNRRRYRSDLKDKTSAKALVEDGWTFWSGYKIPDGPTSETQPEEVPAGQARGAQAPSTRP